MFGSLSALGWSNFLAGGIADAAPRRLIPIRRGGIFPFMIETRLQIPDDLYREAERVAREREITLGEVVRRGLEYIVRVYPPVPPTRPQWHPPPPRSLGHFQAPVEDWRLLANEPDAPP